MKRLKDLLILVTAVFCLGTCASCNPGPKTIDVNQDGKPDVIYHHDGENIHKIQADTNYDGTHDITVHIEDGKFKEAHIDADHDGTTDKVIKDPVQFKKWVNDNRPDFNEHLGWDDYSRKIDKVFWKPGGHN